MTLTVCETDPLTSSCKLPPAPSVTIDIATGATPTYGIFVAAGATIAFDPAFNRVTGRFTDAGGVIRSDQRGGAHPVIRTADGRRRRRLRTGDDLPADARPIASNLAWWKTLAPFY